MGDARASRTRRSRGIRVGAVSTLVVALAWGCEADEVVNGCRRGDAVDLTGRAEVVIEFAGLHGHAYVPACVRASVGARLVFRGPLGAHPLGGGRVVDGLVGPDPGNPVHDTAEGPEVAFDLAAPGVHGFFCHVHTGEAMMGAVFVE